MAIVKITQQSNSIDADIRVDVTAATLRLRAGNIRVGDVTHELAETEVPLPPREEARTVRVFLVVRKDTKAMVVLVDECVHDGVDRPYAFAGSPFEPVHLLVVGTLPAQCVDATQGAWCVFQIGPPRAEVAPPSSPPQVDPAQLQELLGKRGLS